MPPGLCSCLAVARLTGLRTAASGLQQVPRQPAFLQQCTVQTGLLQLCRAQPALLLLSCAAHYRCPSLRRCSCRSVGGQGCCMGCCFGGACHSDANSAVRHRFCLPTVFGFFWEWATTVAFIVTRNKKSVTYLFRCRRADLIRRASNTVWVQPEAPQTCASSMMPEILCSKPASNLVRLTLLRDIKRKGGPPSATGAQLSLHDTSVQGLKWRANPCVGTGVSPQPSPSSLSYPPGRSPAPPPTALCKLAVF